MDDPQDLEDFLKMAATERVKFIKELDHILLRALQTHGLAPDDWKEFDKEERKEHVKGIVEEDGLVCYENGSVEDEFGNLAPVGLPSGRFDDWQWVRCWCVTVDGEEKILAYEEHKGYRARILTHSDSNNDETSDPNT